MTDQTQSQRLEAIRLLMQYAVPAGQMQEALTLLDRYQNDTIATNLLHAFYSYLPEGEDDGVRALRLLARKQGSFLLAAVTFRTTYLYLATVDDVLFLGEHDTGIWDQEVLDHFNLGSRETFLEKYRNQGEVPEYLPAQQAGDLCPACAAADGEEHVLGCPVEVCPWCDGQLTRCNCRFEQLDRDHLLGDQEVDAFQEKLVAKGRIPYDSGRHRPGYPSAGTEGTSDPSEWN
ncbi:MAG: hypothetical protein OEV91_01865 [Desulfobulbaceae bacterium]|nr:hypothetical protein [Desulfobulbaceae bacterium]